MSPSVSLDASYRQPRMKNTPSYVIYIRLVFDSQVNSFKIHFKQTYTTILMSLLPDWLGYLKSDRKYLAATSSITLKCE